ncbi:hypothetical protein SLE2022_298480 [Rubroshorea leprosula]
MEDRKDQKNAPRLSVPQFGDWDQKGQLPDYSLDFSKIREMRKQNKKDLLRASLGNEEELINPAATTASTNTASTTAPSNYHHGYPQNHHHGYPQNHHPPTVRRSFFSYFNCCVKA